MSNANWCLVVFCATLYLQQVRGLSVFEAGVLFLPLSAGAAVGGPLSGRLAGHIAPGHLMATGMLVAAGAVGVMTLSHVGPVWIPAFGITGIGLGLAYATTNDGTLAAVPAG